MNNAMVLSEVRVDLAKLTKNVNSLNSRPLSAADRGELLAIQQTAFKTFAEAVQILMQKFNAPQQP